MLPIPITRAVTSVARFLPSLHFSSKVRLVITKNVNRDDTTANAKAIKKQIPIRRPPGSFLKISVISRNTRLCPFCTSTPASNAEGIITNLKRIAATEMSN